MSKTLTQVPTAELIRRAKRNRFERGLVRSGCLISVIVVIAFWIMIFRNNKGNLFSIVSAVVLCLWTPCVVPILLHFVLRYAADFRNRRIISELNWRHGRASARAYKRHYFRQPVDAADVLIFHCAILPHGSLFDAKINLRQGGEASGDAVCMEIDSTNETWDNALNWSGQLSAETSKSISSLIQQIDRSEEIEEPYTVLDGLPARLHILQPKMAKMISFDANLAAFDEEDTPTDVRVQLLDLITQQVIDLFEDEATKDD